MKQKKNIDQLFNERFANHQADPPSHVWDKVQARLEKDKKDRVIAIWWRSCRRCSKLGSNSLLGRVCWMLRKANVVVEQQPEVKNNSTRLYTD